MRKTSHKYKHGNRLKNKFVWIISSAIFACAMLSHFGNVQDMNTPDEVNAQSYFLKADRNVEVVKVVTESKPVPHDPSKEEIVSLIKKYFPVHSKEMIAIGIAESNLTNNRTGYNCFYKGNVLYQKRVSGAVSKACKVEDRVYAWSIDCFALQRNYIGRLTCPTNVTLEQHIKEVSELSKIQGLEAWSTFNNGAYKLHLSKI